MHEHHRVRMRQRLLKEGIDNLAKHEILEILLFYSIPQKNTNDIAHLLLDRFGSLSNVFDASIEELLKVKGVGQTSASLIKFLPELCRVYIEDQKNCRSSIIDTEKAGKIFVNKFVGRLNEFVVLMLLDSKNKLLFCDTVCEGSIHSVEINIKKIVSLAVNNNASKAILAHNHPSGMALPSKDDIITTINTRDALKLIDVRLIDHIIVADHDYISLADTDLDLF